MDRSYSTSYLNIGKVTLYRSVPSFFNKIVFLKTNKKQIQPKIVIKNIYYYDKVYKIDKCITTNIVVFEVLYNAPAKR